MERQEVKHIGSRVMNGSLEKLLEVLDKRPDHLTEKQALYFIVCCSHTCNSNINNCNKLNEQKLITAVKGLSTNIKNLNSEEYDNYIQGIYFICRFLLKKNYLLLPQLENEILPRFLPEPLTERQKNVYKSICCQIQIDIENVVAKKTDVNEKMIITIGYLLSKIILRSSNQQLFLETIFRFSRNLQFINLTLQFDYFLYNISKIKNLPPETVRTGILPFFNYGLHFYSTYLKNGMLELSQKCINDMLNILPKECGYEEILNICKYIVDPIAVKNGVISGRECIIRSFKLNRKSEHFLSIYKLLSKVMVSYSYFCRDHDVNRTFADPEKHMIIYEILSVMIEIFVKLSGSCVKECKCLLTNSSECSDAATCILILFYILLAANDITRDYIKRVKCFLEKYFEILVARKLNKCEAYKKSWFQVAPHLHNVGVLLSRKKEYEEALSFVNMTLKYYSLLDILQNNVVLSGTFSLMNSIYLKQKKFKDALLWSAVEIINTQKNDRDQIFHKWIKIKLACREELSSELQELTVVSITETIPSNFVCFIEQAKTKEAQIELLISELEMYQVKWRSKIPMMSSFRHLCEIADKSTIMKMFVHLFTDNEIRVHEKVPILLKNVFEEFENSKEEIHNESLKLYYSFYNFFQYKYQTIDLISKNLEEMDKVTSLTKNTNTTNDVMPADAFDRCDIVTAYENLKINGGKLSYLEASLKTLESIILPNLSKSFIAEVDPKKVYELTKNIAIEFILYSDGLNTLRALFLAFNIAQYLSDKHLLLECSSYFLKYLNFSDFEQNMEHIVCNLEDDQKSFQYLLQYYMNLSFFYLSDRNIQLAYQHYKNAEKYWNDLLEENKKKLWFIEVSMELLLFKLMNIAMSENFEMEVEFTYGPLMKAYNLILNRYTSGAKWTTQSMIVLFEVYETIIKMYYDLKMPREVRCFGKQSLMLAQQHVIPVYSAKFLSYLAHADIWSEKFDDCRVKLDGISDILLLEKTENGPKIVKQKTHLIVPSVNDIMEGISEMMLDNPPPSAFNVSSFPASPVLQGQAYRSPFFASHTFCKCFHCTSLECQKTILLRYHLEALWYMHKGQVTLADSFFKGSFKLHEYLSDKRKDIFRIFHNHITKYTDNYGNFSEQDNEAILSFNEIKIHASINYTKFLSSSGALEAAKKFNENAIKKFTKAKLHYPHLYGEMLLQKIALNYKQLENGNRNATNIAESLDYRSNDVIKTPEACGSKLNTFIPKINSPRIKKFLTPKVIKFNLADSESNATPLKSSNKSTSKAKTPKSKILPPSLRTINTPILKTPNLKKNLNTGCKTISSEIFQNNMTGQDQPQKLPLSERSEGSVILSKEQESNLEGKTKLLTSRLRKKHVSENNSTENEQMKEDIQPTRRSRRNRT